MATALREVISTNVPSTRRAFVVVGMHRSGTSAMTRTLSLLGAALPNVLMDSHHDNPTGFWEPQNIVTLNNEILQALDSDWDDVFAFRPRRYLSNFDQFYLGQAVDLLEREFNGSELVVLKDPRISVLSTFWTRALREAGYATHYIVMVRNPLEVAESLRDRDGFPREKSLLLWSSYMIAAERDTRHCNRTFVSYDQLINDWRRVRSRIEESAGVPFPRDTAAAAVAIDRYLNRGLRHHDSSASELFSRLDVPEETKTLYRIFSSACDGAALDFAAMEAVQAQLEKMDLLIGPLVADLRSSTHRLSAEIAQTKVAHDQERGRADSLEEQLAAERSIRNAELEAAATSRSEYEQRIAELGEGITRAEAERDRAMVEAEEKARELTELGERLSEAEAERAHLSTAAQEKNERDLAERRAIHEQIAALRRQLRQHEAAAGKARTALVRKDAELKATRKRIAKATAAMQSVRDDSRREIERARNAFASDLKLAQEGRSNADAAARVTEEKLAQRFQEVATLSNLLRHQEQRSEQAHENIAWLIALNDRLAAQPRWWSFMPKSWRQRRWRADLRDADVFDVEAYLNRHPDVAAEGMDALEHYLKHGLSEGRSRGC